MLCTLDVASLCWRRCEHLAAGSLLSYVKWTQQGRLPSLVRPSVVQPTALLEMDAATRRSLNLLESAHGKVVSALLPVALSVPPSPVVWCHTPSTTPLNRSAALRVVRRDSDVSVAVCCTAWTPAAPPRGRDCWRSAFERRWPRRFPSPAALTRCSGSRFVVGARASVAVVLAVQCGPQYLCSVVVDSSASPLPLRQRNAGVAEVARELLSRCADLERAMQRVALSRGAVLRVRPLHSSCPFSAVSLLSRPIVHSVAS
jgi:hypothetical protein